MILAGDFHAAATAATPAPRRHRCAVGFPFMRHRFRSEPRWLTELIARLDGRTRTRRTPTLPPALRLDRAPSPRIYATAAPMVRPLAR